MASLENQKIKDTYDALLKVSDNGSLDATPQEITDGLGNGTGVSLNTAGDVVATGTVSFGSLKDTAEDITVTKFVDAADGIAANDNDTSIPTSAAVKSYVDTNITVQDLDITDGTNTSAIDLDSQSLTFTGDSGVSATVSAQTVTFDSSALQSQITNNDTDISALQSADITLQSNIDAEETARIAADSTLQTNIDNEEAARIAADTTETTARIAADTAIQNSLDAESAARATADGTLQANIDAEASTRSTADTTLQSNIDAEATARASADTSLQTQITSNDTDIAGLDTRVTAAEGAIVSNDGDISGLDSRLTVVEANQATTGVDFTALEARVTVNEGDIATLETGKQDISEKGQANGYAPLDSGAKIATSYLPDSVLGQLEYQGTWNASTDTPTLPAASTVKGHYYVVSTGGTYETITYAIGDWIVSNGTAWEKVDNTDAVTSVFGRLGAIVANEADYSSFYPLLADFNAVDSQVTTNTTKLAGIEDGADVTDAANVAAAGALMSGTAVLSDLADVSTATPVDGQVLTYDTINGWQPEAPGAAPVDSVNGQTGAVVLDADDIDDAATTNKFTTQAEIDKLAGIEAGADVTDSTNVTTALGSISVTAHSDVTSAGSGAIITSAERTKLAGIEDAADVTDAANVTVALGTVSVTAHSDVSSAGSGQIITSAERTQLQNADPKYTVSVISGNTTGVKDVLYVFTASLTLTLPASPSVGDKIKFSNMSGTTTPVIARNGSLIAGLAENLTVDVDNFGAELIYTGATKGWVIL